MKKYGSKKQHLEGIETKITDQFGNKDDGLFWQIYDIKLFSRDKHELLNVLRKKLALSTKKYWIATVNPEFVMEAQKDQEFKKILGKTSINIIDGIGLVWAMELCRRLSVVSRKNYVKKLMIGCGVGIEVLRGRFKDQVSSGADLIVDLVKIAKSDNKKIFLLGGWGDRAEKTTKYFRSQVSGLRCQWCEGEPTVAKSEVLKKINSYRPDILLVAYGMKKQEFWINENLNKIDVGLVMGVGRSFDYYSGELKRAPNWVRKMGMEWLYSLIEEPKRLKRQLVLPKFILKVLSSN